MDNEETTVGLEEDQEFVRGKSIKQAWDATEFSKEVPMELVPNKPETPQTEQLHFCIGLQFSNGVVTYMPATDDIEKIRKEIVKWAMNFQNIDKVLVIDGYIRVMPDSKLTF